MPDTGSKRSPKILKGALVQLIPDVVGVTPNIVVFQFNPETLTRSIRPFDPQEVDQTERGATAPTVQPFSPRESFDMSVEFDATDELEDGDPIAEQFGIADRIAALQKMLQPSEGLIGDFIARAGELLGQAESQAIRQTVPVVLFTWGPGRILPVRITQFSIEETLYSTTLYPTQATVSLGLEVLTPDVFKNGDITNEIAIGAYRFTKAQEAALAVLNIANNVDEIRGLLPF